jgi:hypothetical protein
MPPDNGATAPTNLRMIADRLTGNRIMDVHPRHDNKSPTGKITTRSVYIEAKPSRRGTGSTGNDTRTYVLCLVLTIRFGRQL